MFKRILFCSFFSLVVQHSFPHVELVDNSLITDTPYVHDPAMAYEKGVYHLYCTGEGIMEYTSIDRKEWQLVNPVIRFSFPAWIYDSVPNFKNQIWAPDIIHWHDKWWMTYACSSFGSNTSAIGLLSNNCLSNDSTWNDSGCIISTREGIDSVNAIDPALIIDREDHPWLTYGSFWDGIQLVRLDSTIHIKEKTKSFTIACRYPLKSRNRKDFVSKDAGKNAIEAPFIFWHDGYYYLFVSWDYCCRGLKSNYRVVVGRSKRIYGPYLDRKGLKMTRGGGTLVIKGDKKRFAAVGHCAVYHFIEGDFLICHGYSIHRGGEPILLQRQIKWDVEGWPIVIV